MAGLVAGCVAETGIDNTVVVGSVVIEPIELRKVDEVDLGYGVLKISGRGNDTVFVDAVVDMPLELDVVGGAADLVKGGSTPDSLEAGKTYRLEVVADDDWTVTLYGANPDGAGILVGMYPREDLLDRGRPMAGSTVSGFERDGERWTANWKMTLVRRINPKGRVNEHVRLGWVYAGDWSSLNQDLPAGTWHSAEPLGVRVWNNDGRIEAGSVTVDSIAPIVVGFDTTEVEPNDAFDAANFEPDPGDEQDVGTLSGVGFVDYLRGSIDYVSDEVDYVHDVDVFKFEVAEPTNLLLTVVYDDANASVDTVTHHFDGTFLDYAWGYGSPAVGGGLATYEPGTIYYLSVLGYFGPEDGSANYEVAVEQLAP